MCVLQAGFGQASLPAPTGAIDNWGEPEAAPGYPTGTEDAGGFEAATGFEPTPMPGGFEAAAASQQPQLTYAQTDSFASGYA